MFGDMAKVLDGSLSDSLDPAALMANLTKVAATKANNAPVEVAPSLPAGPYSGAVVRSSFPAENVVIVKEKTDCGRRSLSVKIHELRNVSSIADENVSLQVSESQVLFSTAADRVVQVTGQFKLDANTTKASFSKKRGVLSVEVDIVN